MSVSLNPPNTLGFRRPFTQLVKRTLLITNHNTQPVAFKVKTTAPKLYCVRPNSGRVESGESVEVSVMLQAMKEEPPLNAKCKDKFLIQSTLITPEKETLTLNEIWASPDLAEEKLVHQQKLRVAYLPAEGQTLEEEDEGPSQANQSSMYVANEPSRYDTVRGNGILETQNPPIPTFLHSPPEETHRPPTPTGDFSVAREESHESPHDAPLGATETTPRPPSPPVPAASEHVPESEHEAAPIPIPAPVPVAAPFTRDTAEHDELLARYQEAQEEIRRLRSTLATMAAVPQPELRRRTRALSDAGSAAETDIQTVVEEAPYQQEGVPLQVVVIIALGVFITTYLFF